MAVTGFNGMVGCIVLEVDKVGLEQWQASAAEVWRLHGCYPRCITR